MHYLETPKGIKWHYELHGEGLPVLFIHGWGVNLRIWRQQIKYFSRSFRILAIDLPGHGQTHWKKISLKEMVEDIEFIIKKCGFEKVGIVGSSLGGLVALKMYEVHPQAVSFIVFVGSQPKFAKSDDYPYGLDVGRFRKLSGQLQQNFQSMINIFFRSLFTKEERATRRFKWIQTFRKADFTPDKEAALSYLDVLEKEDLRQVLEKVSVPVQFINGTEDYICRKEMFEQLQEKMPQARFDWFSNCGHFPFLSQPYEFNKVLHNFLVGLH